jgi:hypothetical protein
VHEALHLRPLRLDVRVLELHGDPLVGVGRTSVEVSGLAVGGGNP